jgi:VWFA-related protein
MAASKVGEVSMEDTKAMVRVVLGALLTAALAVPPGSLRASAQEPGPQKPNQEEKKPQYSISVEAPVVNVDAVVTDQDGNILSGLKKENFRVLDDGAPQTITNFAPTDAPITIVVVMEFSRLAYGFFAGNAKYWSYDFLHHLGPKDWVAVMTFDLKSTVLVDFTQNKSEVQNAIGSLYFPGFSEANMFDAILDTLDRLKDVQGKKSILLLASGFDTFSKHNLDQTLKEIKHTDVTIFAVGIAEELAVRMGNAGITYEQAKNELSTFSRLTGGFAWFPRFDGELPSIFNSVTAFLRNQYTLGYTPTNPANDGKYHKIKVEILGDDGNPLVITNKKGKKQKIIVYAREGYTARKASVGD